MSKNNKKSIPTYYWDSCVFLSYIMNEKDRASTVLNLLEEAENGRVKICTSIISIVEVAFAKTEKDKKSLSPEIEKKINELWLPASPIKILDFYELIAKDSRDLIRLTIGKKYRVRPADAIHLTTAKKIGATEFHSYDKKLNKKEIREYLGFDIKEPESEGTLFDDVEVENNEE